MFKDNTIVRVITIGKNRHICGIGIQVNPGFDGNGIDRVFRKIGIIFNMIIDAIQ